MEEEIKKILKDMQNQIDALEDELSNIKNHKHDFDGYVTSNY
ncbi:MAG: hypothetical protein AABW83_02415 [Nanoarchaeota archaeon]